MIDIHCVMHIQQIDDRHNENKNNPLVISHFVNHILPIQHNLMKLRTSIVVTYQMIVQR